MLKVAGLVFIVGAIWFALRDARRRKETYEEVQRRVSEDMALLRAEREADSAKAREHAAGETAKERTDRRI
ncbi:MAG: hypothetical protein AB7D51_03040 [Desulfovibrionaceae bacterium]